MRRLVLLAVAVVAVVTAPVRAQAPRALSDSAFASLVARLSESPGYFDTDNLITNEDSYLHVVGTLNRISSGAGAYLGVGPDQNFSYIAALKPRVAFVIDIRRDNMLHHLLFKSLFALSRNRVEYLCLLFGKTAPADTTGWGARDITALLAYTDNARSDAATAARIQASVIERVKTFAVPLSQADLATIGRFHSAFITQGPALRFNTAGRAPQWYHPDLRKLLRETDRSGRQSSYVAHEADFQYVKSLEGRNLVIPIVGDFGGGKAIAGVAGWLRSHNETVAAFYTSNVEQYLFRDGSFERFALNVAQLPRSPNSVMLRSYFLRNHPQAVTGYYATQVAQPIERFVAIQTAGGFRSYFELLTRDLVSP